MELLGSRFSFSFLFFFLQIQSDSRKKNALIWWGLGENHNDLNQLSSYKEVHASLENVIRQAQKCYPMKGKDDVFCGGLRRNGPIGSCLNT